MGKFTFRKEERLRKEKDIQELFDKGSSFYLFPFKVFVLLHDQTEEPVHQILISVSKKNFKRAVDRNAIKRRIREAYRLQKQLLPDQPKLKTGFIYSHKEILDFEEIKRKMGQCLVKIPKILSDPSRKS
ncbi:MAG TPA: ribonuclease P protein component [Ohtaekwangia sp.]